MILGSNSFSASSFIDYVLTNTEAKIIAISRSKEFNIELLAYKNNKQSERVSFYQLDLNKNINEIVSLIYDFKVEYIINFSAQGMVAQSWDSPIDWFKTNTLALVDLLDKIYKFSFIKKFVQVSTPEVYGNCNNIKESMNFAPSSPYASSKASGDLILYSYFKTKGFPINYTRASNVYGAYQQLYRIIPKTILSIKKGNKINLHNEGKAIRSFIHIKDVAKATLIIANNATSGDIYHLSDTKTISIYDLVKMIGNELSVDINEYIKMTKDRASQDALYFLNSDKLYEDFKIKPEIDLKNGIKEVIKWIDDDYDKLIQHPDYYIHKK